MALYIGYTCNIFGPFMKFQDLTTFDCLYKLLLRSSAVPEQIYYSTLDNEAILCSGTAKDQKPRLYDYLKVLANLIFGLSATRALGFIMSFPGIPTYIPSRNIYIPYTGMWNCYCIKKLSTRKIHLPLHLQVTTSSFGSIQYGSRLQSLFLLS